MKFKDHFYDESTVFHHSDRPSNEGRDVVKPTAVPLPDGVPENARLYSVYNEVGVGIYTVVFDETGKNKIGVIIGTVDNPSKQGYNDSKEYAEMVWKKEHTPYNKTPLSYGGEVRLEPPFKDYKEHPIDKGAEYFNDFSPNTEYDAGETIEDEPTPRG